MKVMNISSAYNAPVFRRRLRENEKQEYRQDTIQQAFDYLGIKEVAMIMHGSCFPVESQDFGVGSPYSQESEDVIEFEKLHGFNNNQLGPNGKISKADVSPYKSTVFARNELFIDLKALKQDKYANILSDKMTNGLLHTLEIKYPSDDKNYSYSHFYDGFENYDIALNAAYDNFQKKLLEKNPNAIKLNGEYQEFKKHNKNRLIKEGLFRVLSKTYGTGDFRIWENSLDKDLLKQLKAKNIEAIDRYNYLTSKFKKDLNVYTFEQFIADKQIEENKKFRKDNNFKYISDLLVGFSPCDEWINQEAFLPGWRMGCPNGGKNDGPQLWDVPVLDPNKLFKEDGTLATAGILLKNKIDAALEDCDNVRVDHALGLIDPYIYDENSVEYENDNLSDKFNAGNMSHLGFDPQGNYKKILEKIIIPSMREHGLDPQDAVWEDLSNNDGTWFYEVYKKKHNLPGITQLEFARSEGSSRKNWALLGSHDSQPALKLIREQAWVRNHDAWNPMYLAGFLHWDEARAKERDAFCARISNNPMDRVKAKFAELFMNSEKIQIAFPDFFGINQVYNYGGKNYSTNWKLRLSKDYEDAYYKNLSSDNPTALNLPEILTIAVKAQMDRQYVQYLNKKKDAIKQYKNDHVKYDELLKEANADALQYKNELHRKMEPLLGRLDKFTNILKEKED